jgi:hypothetical protein
MKCGLLLQANYWQRENIRNRGATRTVARYRQIVLIPKTLFSRAFKK